MMEEPTTSSGTAQLCIIYAGDGRMWFDYFTRYLNKVLPTVDILEVREDRLVDYFSADGADHSLIELMYRSSVYIVISTPGLLQCLSSHTHINLCNCISDVRTSVLFLCGTTIEDFLQDLGCTEGYVSSTRAGACCLEGVSNDARGSRLCERLPDFEKWLSFDHDQWEMVVKKTAEMIEGSTTEDQSHKSTPRPRNCAAGSEKSSSSAGSTARKFRRSRKKRDFRIIPQEACCEGQTMMLISFNEAVDVDGTAHEDDEVVVCICDATNDGFSVTLKTERINPCTYSFTAPEHFPGEVTVQVLVGGKVVGSGKVKYSQGQMVDTVLGLMKIHNHQMSAVLETIERVGGLSEERERIDRALSSVVNDAADEIPVQAFERYFCAYRYNETVKMKEELPNMLFIAARYGLNELASALIDLPDARLAHSVTNCEGLSPEAVAEKFNHAELSVMLSNCRELSDGFEKLYEDYFKNGYIKLESDVLTRTDIVQSRTAASAAAAADNGDGDSSSDYEQVPTDRLPVSIRFGKTNQESATFQDLYLEVIDDAADLVNVKPQSFQFQTSTRIASAVCAVKESDRFRESVGRDKFSEKTSDKQLQSQFQDDVKQSDVSISTSQKELIDIMNQVKEKQLSLTEAEVLFKEWQLRKQTGLTTSFQQKQRQLAHLREEVASVQREIEKSQPSAIKSLFRALRSSFTGRNTAHQQQQQQQGSEIDQSNTLRRAEKAVTCKKTANVHSRSSTSSVSSRDSNASFTSRTSGVDMDEATEYPLHRARGINSKSTRPKSITLQKLDEELSSPDAQPAPPIPLRTYHPTSRPILPFTGSQPNPPHKLSSLPENQIFLVTAKGILGTDNDEYVSADVIEENTSSPDDLYATHSHPPSLLPALPVYPIQPAGSRQASLPDGNSHLHHSSGNMDFPRKGSLPEFTVTQRAAAMAALASEATAATEAAGMITTATSYIAGSSTTTIPTSVNTNSALVAQFQQEQNNVLVVDHQIAPKPRPQPKNSQFLAEIMQQHKHHLHVKNQSETSNSRATSERGPGVLPKPYAQSTRPAVGVKPKPQTGEPEQCNNY